MGAPDPASADQAALQAVASVRAADLRVARER
jgi:hypothetical protein